MPMRNMNIRIPDELDEAIEVLRNKLNQDPGITQSGPVSKSLLVRRALYIGLQEIEKSWPGPMSFEEASAIGHARSAPQVLAWQQMGPNFYCRFWGHRDRAGQVVHAVWAAMAARGLWQFGVHSPVGRLIHQNFVPSREEVEEASKSVLLEHLDGEVQFL